MHAFMVAKAPHQEARERCRGGCGTSHHNAPLVGAVCVRPLGRVRPCCAACAHPASSPRRKPESVYGGAYTVYTDSMAVQEWSPLNSPLTRYAPRRTRSAYVKRPVGAKRGVVGAAESGSRSGGTESKRRGVPVPAEAVRCSRTAMSRRALQGG